MTDNALQPDFLPGDALDTSHPHEVRRNVIPGPGALALLALCGAVLFWRRRRIRWRFRCTAHARVADGGRDSGLP